MYRSAGKGTEDVVKRITEADAAQASKIVDLAEKLGQKSDNSLTTDAQQAAHSMLRSKLETVLDPEGSWEGEGGLHLSRAENAAADKFLARARTAESQISPTVVRIRTEVPGAETVGFPDYVLKSPESFKRKFADALARNPQRNVDQALRGMKDSVRYTFKFPSEGAAYSDGVRTVIGRFQNAGFENVKFKNFWGSADYQGINSFWRDPQTGHVFEMQFHTQESFDAKMVTHGLYEEARLPGVSDERFAELQEQQMGIFAAVPRPGAASEIKLPRK